MIDFLLFLSIFVITATLLIPALEARVGSVRAAEILSKPAMRVYLVVAALIGIGIAGAVVYSILKDPEQIAWTSLIPCTMMTIYAGLCLWLLWLATLSRQRMESSRWVFGGEAPLQKYDQFMIGFTLCVAIYALFFLTMHQMRLASATDLLERTKEVRNVDILPFHSAGLATRHLFTDGLEVSIDPTGVISTRWLTKGNPPLSGRDYFFALLWPLLSITALWLWKRLTPRSEILGGLFGIIALLIAIGQIPFILLALFS